MDDSKDDLKWFGEGFEGFPKRLPDDCVEYILVIIDSSLSQKEQLTRLELIRKEALQLKKKLLQEYIWQRDEFNFRPEIQNTNGLKYLHGITNFGDSVEDEWLIVFLLRELSKEFPELWIHIVDTDGEFLLIEAANTLPQWLNPEIADNRVWVNNGRLLIIPIAAKQSFSSLENKITPTSKSLTLAEACKIISITPQILIHPSLIEVEAFYRLRNYPMQINKSLHHARAVIPRKLAYILHFCPAAIAPAVEAFYLRDPIALKQLQKDGSELTIPPEDLITVSVKFTKVLYAQLKSQQFSAPNTWKSIMAEAEKAAKSDYAKQATFTHLELGMKVTAGFEMLINDTIHQDNRSVQEVKILLDDVQEGTTLPTDTEISAWTDAKKQDDESWLDINFEDFEKELQGSGGLQSEAARNTPANAFGPQPPSGFGDPQTQADLRKMVQRFEDFLNDDKAGIDGAEIDDMDIDEDANDDSEDEDKAVSFDEKEFTRMMQEMMGMPSKETDDSKVGTKRHHHEAADDADDGNDEEDEDEGEEIRKVMAQIEAELTSAGAFNLDPPASKLVSLESGTDANTQTGSDLCKGKLKNSTMNADEGQQQKDWLAKQDWESDSDEDVQIDFNLAKNLLESFKSQAGMAGPGGNLMGMMGMQIPRDEDGKDEHRT